MFSNGYFLLNDIPRLGKAFEIDVAQILTMRRINKYITLKIANTLKISKWGFENPLRQFGYINHFDVWNWNVYWCSISWNKLWLKINSEMKKMIRQANGKSSHFPSYYFYLKDWIRLEANTHLWSSLLLKINVQNYLKGG